MSGFLLLPITLAGFIASLLDVGWGVPLLLGADGLAHFLSGLPLSVVLGSALLLLGALGLKQLSSEPERRSYRWLPLVGLLAGGWLAWLLGGGGLGCFYGMVAGTTIAGCLGGCRRGGIRSLVGWLVEALRWTALGLGGIWLFAHLL